MPRLVVAVKRKRASAQSSQPQAPEEVGSEYWNILRVRFFNACFLQKSRIDFDESDEEEMQDLLATAPACPITNAGQSHVTEDARVGPSDLIGSGARGTPQPLRLPRRVWKRFSSR